MRSHRHPSLCTLILLVFAACLSGPAPAAQWSRTYGGSGVDDARSIRPTADGGYVVAGSTTSFGLGGSDAWVLKLDASGGIVWQRSYGGPYNDVARSVAPTADGGYLVAGQADAAGANAGSAWVLKLDGDGAIVWQRTYGFGTNGPDDATSVQPTSDGGSIVAGYGYPSRSFGAGVAAAWLLKLDDKGNVDWQRTYGDATAFYALAVRPLTDGNYVLAGYTFRTYSFGASLAEAWLAKLDANGQVIWQRTYGGPGVDIARAVEPTPDGGYVVAGFSSSFGGGSNAWVLKLDGAGYPVWQKIYSATGYDGAYAVQPTADGGYVLAGSGAWVMKLDGAGNVIWSRTYGGGSDATNDVRPVADGGYVVAGATVLNGATPDAWVLKLDANGEIPGCSTMATTRSLATIAGASIANTAIVGTVSGGAAAIGTGEGRDSTTAPRQQCRFSDPKANYQGLWWNAPAGSESGWGLNFAHQGDVIFATWYTYDAGGKAWWLSMTAARAADDTYSGMLYQSNGPPFGADPFDPGQVARRAVGQATLTFGDTASGTFAYEVNGVRQTKLITRQAFGPLPTCVWGAQTDPAAATNYQDLWWAAPPDSESGWGVNFAHEGDTIFATWFTYDVDGSPLWLSATTPWASAGTYTGTLYRTTGPAFSANPFDPNAVTRAAVGTLALTFANGNAATYAYTVTLPGSPAVEQTKTITRQVFRAPGTLCH